MSLGSPNDAARREELLGRAADSALFGVELAAEDIAEARELGVDLRHETLMLELAAAAVAVAEIEAAELDGVNAASDVATRRDPSASTSTRSPERLERSTAPAVIAQVGPSRARDLFAAAAGVVLGACATVVVLRNGAASRDADAALDPVRFVASRPSAVHWPWRGSEDSGIVDSHLVGTVGGEAYFDPATGEGLLEIAGLARNDPSREQYQLWIFDAERDERYPVDGGVFDVSGDGRTLVPVRARLTVARPVMFAVTIERPGGAVVSDRRIALLARP